MQLNQKTIALTLLLLVLQGCGSLKPQITSDAVDFNRAVEQTNNEVTLMNILRAHNRMPRHYTAISDIKGNFTVIANTAIESTVGIKSGRTSDIEGGATSKTMLTSAAETEWYSKLGVAVATGLRR